MEPAPSLSGPNENRTGDKSSGKCSLLSFYSVEIYKDIQETIQSVVKVTVKQADWKKRRQLPPNYADGRNSGFAAD